MPKGFEARNEGTEPIEGFACRKVVITSGPQEILRAWFADGLGLALRIQGPGGTGGLELKNVKPGPQDAALFALPAGYRLVQEVPEPRPEWAGQIASAARVAPPFEQTLDAGRILRIPPRAGFAIHLAAGNPGPDECTAVSVPFKDGRPLADIRGNRFTLAPEQSVTTDCADSPDQVDELVVRVERGKLKVKAEFVAAAPDRSPGAPPAPPASAEVGISAPEATGVASLVAIDWQGPNGPGDFIAIAAAGQPPGASISRVSANRGTPARLYVPSDPGEYEIRYVAAKPTKVLGKVTLTVTPAAAAVASPAAVDVAAPFEVTWQGPQTEGDMISIARPEQVAGANVFHVRVKDGNPAKLVAPSDAGDYEVRYILGRGSRLSSPCFG